MNERPDPAAIAGLVEDDCARTILVAAREEAMSVTELARRCEVSEPTVYRRLEELLEHDLVEESVRIDEGGHHRNVYRATLDRVAFDVDADGVSVELSHRERMADRFTDIVRRM